MCNFFTARCLNVRFRDLLYFICLKFNPQYWCLQKQPFREVLTSRCSENMQQIYRRTPMTKCDFNKVPLQIYWTHIKAWAFSCKFADINRTPFPKNTSGRLPLSLLFPREKMCWFSSYFKSGKGRNFCGILIKSPKLCLHKIFNIGSTTKGNCHEFFTIFWTDQASRLFVSFQQKKNSPLKMFIWCLCLHHGTYLNGTSNVFAYLLIIFLGHDWFRFCLLNKWGCIRFMP